MTDTADGRSLAVRTNDRGTFTRTPQEPKCLGLTDGAFSRLGGSLNPDDGHIVVTQTVLNRGLCSRERQGAKREGKGVTRPLPLRR